MSTRIFIEVCEGGFVVETIQNALVTRKRLHADAESAADDVRARLRVYAATQDAKAEPETKG